MNNDGVPALGVPVNSTFLSIVTAVESVTVGCIGSRRHHEIQSAADKDGNPALSRLIA